MAEDKASACDYNFVSDPPQEYTCLVCMKILQEPHVTDCCGQHYCRGCLEKWFQKNKEKTCPQCRQPGFNHMLYIPFQRKINELEVYCANKEEGCDETMILADLKAHLASTCRFVKIDCPNECGLLIMRSEKEVHMSDHCMKRIEHCSYCGFETMYDLMDEHLETCAKMPVPCPRNCEETMIRGDIERHEQVCLNMEVQCPFFEAGCTETILRKDLDGHIEKNSTAHLLKFMAGYKALKAEHDNLKKDYEDLKVVCNELKQDFCEFQSQAAIAVKQIRESVHEEKPRHLLKSIDSLVSLMSKNSPAQPPDNWCDKDHKFDQSEASSFQYKESWPEPQQYAEAEQSNSEPQEIMIDGKANSSGRGTHNHEQQSYLVEASSSKSEKQEVVMEVEYFCWSKTQQEMNVQANPSHHKSKWTKTREDTLSQDKSGLTETSKDVYKSRWADRRPVAPSQQRWTKAGEDGPTQHKSQWADSQHKSGWTKTSEDVPSHHWTKTSKDIPTQHKSRWADEVAPSQQSGFSKKSEDVPTQHKSRWADTSQVAPFQRINKKKPAI